MATNPITYRVSPEVDSELRRLAGIHGGVDKALRVMIGWASPLANQKEVKSVAVEDIARQPNSTFTPAIEEKIKANVTPRAFKGIRAANNPDQPRAFKGYIPKPSERK